MGYELHITRVTDRSFDSNITLKECKQLIVSDDSLIMSDNDENTFEWVEHPLGGIDGCNPWFRFSEGRILTRNPDQFFTLKLFKIAKTLNAKLCDKEEELPFEYEQELEADCKAILNRLSQPKKTWWKVW